MTREAERIESTADFRELIVATQARAAEVLERARLALTVADQGLRRARAAQRQSLEARRRFEEFRQCAGSADGERPTTAGPGDGERP